jgi:hypothetical protein
MGRNRTPALRRRRPDGFRTQILTSAAVCTHPARATLGHGPALRATARVGAPGSPLGAATASRAAARPLARRGIICFVICALWGRGVRAAKSAVLGEAGVLDEAKRWVNCSTRDFLAA